MELENNISLTNGVTEENLAQEQNNFLESTLGKVINSALDVGIRMILPDFIEDGVVEVKDALLKGGFKEGVDTAINNAVDLGKSIVGIFTGNFDSISQARDAVKSGGIIDGISGVLDTVLDKTSSTGLISNNVARIISSGKDAILNSVSNKIEDNFTNQLEQVENLSTYENSWKKSFDNKDFDGMQKEYEKIQETLKEIMPLESTIKEARIIENLHTLIKNNNKDFNLTNEQKELANLLS